MPGQRLQFAHSDLSGYPVFEEAFSQGNRRGVGLKKALDWAVFGWVKRRICWTALQRKRAANSARFRVRQFHDFETGQPSFVAVNYVPSGHSRGAPGS